MTDHKMLELLVNEVRSINLALENRVCPSLEALAKEQRTPQGTLAPKSRVEALEEELVVIKEAFRSLSQEIAELKKAQ